MSTDQHNLKPPASAPEPDTAQPNSRKVRSTRYDWAHDTAPAEPPNPNKPDPMAARSSLLGRIRQWLRGLFGSGRNPFGRDDDADPMAA